MNKEEEKNCLPALAVNLEEWEIPATEMDWTEMQNIRDDLDRLTKNTKHSNINTNIMQNRHQKELFFFQKQ